MHPEHPNLPETANEFMHLLIAYGATSLVGIDGCCLLMILASRLHPTDRHSLPIEMFDLDILQMAGFASLKRLDLARRKTVDAGWLQYMPKNTANNPAKTVGIVGKYTLTIPKHFKDLERVY